MRNTTSERQQDPVFWQPLSVERWTHSTSLLNVQRAPLLENQTISALLFSTIFTFFERKNCHIQGQLCVVLEEKCVATREWPTSLRKSGGCSIRKKGTPQIKVTSSSCHVIYCIHDLPVGFCNWLVCTHAAHKLLHGLDQSVTSEKMHTWHDETAQTHVVLCPFHHPSMCVCVCVCVCVLIASRGREQKLNEITIISSDPT